MAFQCFKLLDLSTCFIILAHDTDKNLLIWIDKNLTCNLPTIFIRRYLLLWIKTLRVHLWWGLLVVHHVLNWLSHLSRVKWLRIKLRSWLLRLELWLLSIELLRWRHAVVLCRWSHCNWIHHIWLHLWFWYPYILAWTIISNIFKSWRRSWMKILLWVCLI